MPFDCRTMQPIVPVSVNGGPAVPFVIDTGASISLINRETALQARVAAGQARQMSGGGQGVVDAQFVGGLTLAAGGLTWTEQRAAVTRIGYPDTKHFAGLLGAPILMRYTVQFAFAARRMRLFEPAAYTPPAGAVSIPFQLQEDLPVVRATIETASGSFEARLMVDTGASTFLDLNRPFVEAHGLIEKLPGATARDQPAAIGGTAPFVYATAPRVTLAGLAFENRTIGLSRATSGSSARAERDGIIGNALLQAFDVTVDYSRRLLVLERPVKSFAAAQRAPSVFTILLSGPNVSSRHAHMPANRLRRCSSAATVMARSSRVTSSTSGSCSPARRMCASCISMPPAPITSEAESLAHQGEEGS